MIGFPFRSIFAQEVQLEETSAGIRSVTVISPNTRINKTNTSILKVKLKGSNQSILGNILFEGDRVTFKPYWALDRKLTYEVFLNDRLVEVILPSDSKNKSFPEILAVYPTIDSLPANLLKFYIHFSNKMSEGQSSEYITLLKNDTDTVHRAFLDLQPELWNEDNSILTIWIEPGRLKRDLGPNRILGPALEVGNNYSLVISKEWKDHEGNDFLNDYVKDFRVIEADREYPEVQNWNIEIPKSFSSEALNINFNESLDYLLSTEVIEIIKEEEVISGEIDVSLDGSKWRLIPDKIWSPGHYIIKVGTKLEDLAGNNLNRLFDTDLLDNREVRKKAQEFKERVFTID